MLKEYIRHPSYKVLKKKHDILPQLCLKEEEEDNNEAQINRMEDIDEEEDIRTRRGIYSQI